MRTAPFVAVFMAGFLATACSGTDGPVTTVFIVRHAEKALNQGDDPGLTAAGTARAQTLAHVLAHVPLVAAYATQFRRTQATLAPVAQRARLAVRTADAGDTGGLAARILREHAGKQVVVAAHSNTVGKLVVALGGPHVPDLDDSEYDSLFVLTRAPHWVRLQRLAYGDPTPER